MSSNTCACAVLNTITSMYTHALRVNLHLKIFMYINSKTSTPYYMYIQCVQVHTHRDDIGMALLCEYTHTLAGTCSFTIAHVDCVCIIQREVYMLRHSCG